MSMRLVTVAAATAGIFLASESGAQTPSPSTDTMPSKTWQAEKPRNFLNLFKRKEPDATTAPAAVQTGATQAAAPLAAQVRPAVPKRVVRRAKPQPAKRVETARAAPATEEAWPNPDLALPASVAVADTLGTNPGPFKPQSSDPATRRLDDAFSAIASLGSPAPAPLLNGGGATAGNDNAMLHILSYAAPDPDEAASDAPPVAPAAGPRAERPASAAIDAMIAKSATENGVPVDLARALVMVLSSGNPRATGKGGEIGLMQLQPATARALGFSGANSDLYDPEVNLTYGMRYLAEAQKIAGGDTCLTVHHYSAGHFAKGMTDASAYFCKKVQTAMRQQ